MIGRLASSSSIGFSLGRIACLLALVWLSIWSGESQGALMDYLVGHWTFDNNYLDTSTSGNHAVAYGSPGPTFVDGKIGKAISVTGSTGYVQTSSNVNISGNQARTLNVWFSSPSIVTAAPVSTGGTGTGQLFDLYLKNTGEFGGHFYGAKYDTLTDPSTNPTYALDTWTMATLVYQGGKTVDVYKNGQFFKTATIPGQLNTTNSKLSVGSGGAYGPAYTGLVDDVALWKRALSAAEIQSIYDAALKGYSLFLPLSPLAIQFDGGTGHGTASGYLGPGHITGAFRGGTWNAVVAGTGISSGTVLDESGKTVSNITLEFAGYGANDGNVGTLTNWGTATVAQYTCPNTGWGGIYDTALTGDTVYVSPGDRNVMGTRVRGLPAGTYDVFFVRGTSAYPFDVAIGVNINELANNKFTSPGFQGSPMNNTWVEGTSLQGGNYFHKRVTISGPTDNITIITDVLGAKYNDLVGLQIAKVANPTPPLTFRLQFDMGRTRGIPYGPVGPGHTAGLFTGNEWNALGPSSTGNYSNLSVVDEFGNPLVVDENGTPINLTIQIASNNGQSPLSNWGQVKVSDWSGLSGLEGVNATELMSDALYVSAGNREVMGIRIGGLPMGQYEVFMMPKYGNSTSQQQIAIGVNLNSLVGTSFISPAGSFDEWIQGTATQAGNYYRQLVFVPGPNDWLTMIFDDLDVSTTEFMGFQIARIGVPEPSTLALGVVGFVGLVVLGIRRKKSSSGK